MSPPGVEDPISATFDLSDRVAELAPTVRRMYRYTASILVIWILVMALLILIGLHATLLLSILAVIGLGTGLLALSLLRQTDRFFRAFVQRHRSIHLLREADPVTKIPDGRTPIERLGRYLASASPRVDAALREDPGRLRYRVSLGPNGTSGNFDLVLAVPGGTLYRAAGLGEPGFAILARLASGPTVTIQELEGLARDAPMASRRLGAAVVRLILLRPQPTPLAEEVYEYAVGHPATWSRGFSESRVSVEIITESPDGTYEFIPHILGVP
jgi:uncharacterized membrane protein